MRAKIMTTIGKTHIEVYEECRKDYPTLDRVANVLSKSRSDIIGRDGDDIRKGLSNPEKANVLILGDPGTGKTASVRGFAYSPDTLATSIVLEVNPELLITQGEDKESAMLVGFRRLVEEAGKYSKDHDVITILFIDEFHKIVMYAPSAIEALKPILEKSAANYFRIIASTTFKEYSDNMAGNRAFDQRFLRLTLPELSKDAVLHILTNTAFHWGLEKLTSPTIMEEIYVESKSLLISNAQPRASLDILQAMVAEITKTIWVENGVEKRSYYTPQELGIADEYSISRPILKRAIKRMYSVDIDRGVDVKEVIHALNTRLFNQEQAIATVTSQLEMAAHNFGELDRPKVSFLSTGSTGTGKDLVDSELIPAPVKEGYIRNGDLKIGDFVYGRHGKPIRVSGVYPQGIKTIYRMTLVDGRTIDCGKGHLWTYRNANGNGARNWKTITTEELMKKPLSRKSKSGRTVHSYVLPQSEAVEREAQTYHLDPYVFGALLGNGSFRSTAIDFSSNDTETVHRLESILGFPAKTSCHNYSWYFLTGKQGVRDTLLQTKDILREIPELIGKKSGEKFIPDIYKYGSIKQRWNLIQGLFDTDGNIKNTSRHQVSYSSTSKQLINDIQEVLWSLGITSTVSSQSNTRKGRESKTIEYVLHVKARPEDKVKFFRLTRKIEIAKQAVLVERSRNKHYDTVAIASIEKLDHKESTTCIMVDDEEHLYLAGKGHIVTHNTELAKIISETMSLPLKRFDMSRYASDDNATDFADDLFHAAWSTPNAYLLIDEVEKSSRKAMNILLQVLDDARLNDSVNPDRVASFSGNIINLTTNLGSEVYQNMNMHKDSTAVVDTELIYKALSDAEIFETAVLGRIDAIVPFRPLPFEALMKIAKRALQNMIDAAQTDTRHIIVSDDVVQYIVKDRTSTDSERGGARDVKRNVKNLVVQVLAHYLTYAKEELPVILYIEGRPRFKYKNVADPLNAHVALKECYSIAYVTDILKAISKQIGKPLVNRGLYLPNDADIKVYIEQIMRLASQGHNKFDSIMDGETCVIRGVV